MNIATQGHICPEAWDETASAPNTAVVIVTLNTILICVVHSRLVFDTQAADHHGETTYVNLPQVAIHLFPLGVR
jgi:hypothetical protein